MKTIGQLSIVVLFSFLANYASAQADGKLKMKLNYNVATPLGSFKSDYISNTSFSGGNGEISYWLNKKAAVGLNIGYQSFYQKYPRGTYKTDDGTISAVLSNTVEILPVMISGTFVPNGNTTASIKPYVTAGAGLNLVNYRQYFGEFSTGDASTSLAAQAGAGFMIPVGKDKASALQIGATYNYAPYNNNGLKNLNSVGFNAGITIPIK